MGLFTSKKVKDERKKVIEIVAKLISIEESQLDARFKKTHAKVAISYHDHVVELIEDDHGEKFTVKFNKSKVCLTKKQFGKLMIVFDTAKKNKCGNEKNFDYLETIISK